MGPNLTFDTGALIAWERNRDSVNKVVAAANELQKRIYVPEVVLAEWWRGYTKRRVEILQVVAIDRLTSQQAKAAGEVLAHLGVDRGGAALTIDALVMASAASRGDVVYTSDPDDLLGLQEHFKAVKQIMKV
ncbi:MAG TPA: PIN domain-containing protein [Polyangiaceae bacterium]|jgi:predicted nucleic acid-binding protein|nr:PIN domain-containing protein [Polyangiaceae bacterium]